MSKLRLLATGTANEAVHIAANDMIHITWRHATLRINVTGLLYLVEFMNGNTRRAIGFDAFGTLDDGYELWIQDIGLRLSPDDAYRFRQLLVDGLQSLRTLGKNGEAAHLPDCLKLTVPAEQTSRIHAN